MLFRLAEPVRPPFCLDETEGLAADDRQDILAILNMGYKAGGRVPRCEGDSHTIKSWAVYCPVALAGIASLNRVTEDRAITLVLSRGSDKAKLNAEVDPEDIRFAEIRDLGYRLALTRWQDIADTVRTPELPDWLVARERELWKPLLAVAHLADQEAGLGLVADLLDMARGQGAERAGLSDEADALVGVLWEKLDGMAEIIVSPGELCDDLQVALGWRKPPSAQHLRRLMKRLGFPSASRAAGGKRRVVTLETMSREWTAAKKEPSASRGLSRRGPLKNIRERDTRG